MCKEAIIPAVFFLLISCISDNKEAEKTITETDFRGSWEFIRVSHVNWDEPGDIGYIDSNFYTYTFLENNFYEMNHIEKQYPKNDSGSVDFLITETGEFQIIDKYLVLNFNTVYMGPDYSLADSGQTRAVEFKLEEPALEIGETFMYFRNQDTNQGNSATQNSIIGRWSREKIFFLPNLGQEPSPIFLKKMKEITFGSDGIFRTPELVWTTIVYMHEGTGIPVTYSEWANEGPYSISNDSIDLHDGWPDGWDDGTFSIIDNVLYVTNIYNKMVSRAHY